VLSILLAGPALAAPLPPRAASPSPNETTRRHSKPKPLFSVCPVDKPRHYFAGDFGSIRYGGGVHRHQGVDILAPYGTKIRAPFNGVIEVSHSAQGGLGVYLHGRKGFVFNAHLARLGKTGRVQAGTVIGYVGTSGNASGSAPHDHFEWHPGGGGAVDPYPLLQQACTGRHQWKPHRRTPLVDPRRFLLTKLF
jgi:murein DD-endopeptidase MepM/ murein hydrolase activator NlpD